MTDALTPEGRVLFAEDAHALVVFAMSEAHPEDTARIVAEEEAAASALIGTLPCPETHSPYMTRYTVGPRAGTAEAAPMEGPCSACGAVV